MSSKLFFDQAKINIQSGAGGNGVVAFRREKYVPRGGPNGGNGGRGGHVYFVATPDLNTLLPFKHHVHYRAERGGHGSGANKTGATASDLRIEVPLGTLIRHGETKELLADLSEEGQEALVLEGGRPGRGNAAFKSARNKAPRLAEKGEPGVEMWVELELKLVADVGIIGVPNAGKSTLLSVISAARPKIASYPFTTLVPNLGVVNLDYRQMVFADIPGLMEGAHQGTGLGLDFLRHVERTRVLVHLLNGDSPDPLGDLEAINQELTLFNPALAEKPQIVVLNKMDLPQAQEWWPSIKEAIEAQSMTVMNISAVTQENVKLVLYRVQEMLDALPVEEEPEEEMVEITPKADPNIFSIRQIDQRTWQIQGVAIERIARMTNWDYYESTMRFQRILEVTGIAKGLREAGAIEGHTVTIAGIELVWGYENAFDD